VHLVGFIIRIYHDARSPELLSSYQQTCMTYNIAVCAVKKS